MTSGCIPVTSCAVRLEEAPVGYRSFQVRVFEQPVHTVLY